MAVAKGAEAVPVGGWSVDLGVGVGVTGEWGVGADVGGVVVRWPSSRIVAAADVFVVAETGSSETATGEQAASARVISQGKSEGRFMEHLCRRVFPTVSLTCYQVVTEVLRL